MSKRPILAWTAIALLVTARALSAQVTQRASVDSAGVEADGPSYHRAALDNSGNNLAFDSDATNLVANDGNTFTDVFFRDQIAGTTVLVSVALSGQAGDGTSENPHLASLGRYVVFHSSADDLTLGDLNGEFDVFLRDLVGGTTTLVSRAYGGGSTDGPSWAPHVSADGRYVAFASDATDIVPNDTNGQQDVFMADLSTGTTICLSVDPNGVPAGNGRSTEVSISADGLWAAFQSDADNLLSSGDTNFETDIFLRDIAAGITTRVSVRWNGAEADGASFNPSLSEDGLFVAFESDATNLGLFDTNYASDIFIHDVATGMTGLVSRSSAFELGNDGSSLPMISATGRYVTYTSGATNLVADDTNGVADVFVTDRERHVTHRVSRAAFLAESAGGSYAAAISGSGRVCSWVSAADDFVLNDTNGVEDLFARVLTWASSTEYGTGYAGTLGIPSIALSDPPVIGARTTLEIGNSFTAQTSGLLIGGLSDTSILTGRDGTLLVVPSYFLPLTIPFGQLEVDFRLPANDLLEGMSIFVQVLELDPGATAGVSFTAGLELVCGW